MKQCRSIKNNGNQCTRQVSKGNFCWQHKPRNTGITLLTILGFLAAVFGLWWSIPNVFNRDILPKLEEWEIVDIVCDRDTELGCTIDLVTEPNFSDPFNESTKNKPRIFFQIETSRNNNSVRPFNYAKDTFSFPPSYYEEKNDKIIGPWKSHITDGQISFIGKLYDLKTDQLIGWFNGNEFEIVKACSFSWNKDDLGLEIMDQYGHVCFSIDYHKDETWKGWGYYTFKGYYKDNEYYYIYNGDIHKTTSQKEAIKQIKKIEPIFDHFSKNSLEKRL